MIAHFFCHDDDGRIMLSGSCPTSMLEFQTVLPGTTLREGLANHLTDYWDGEKVVKIPNQPTLFHDWDWFSKTWVPNLNRSHAERIAEVDAERVRRDLAPIAYMGSLFDADAQARENISGTLARLLRGDGLPSGWLGWRDYDNAMHWATDNAATVQTHLAALSCAIEDRKQALLIAAWQHKASLLALSTVEDALNYDVSVGWPL